MNRVEDLDEKGVTGTVKNPKLTGFECQVQRPNSEAAGAKGELALGVVVLPNGEPSIVVLLSHPDGGQLVAYLGGGEVATLNHLMTDVEAQALTISAAVMGVTVQ
jgi:hypothetical protein